MKHLRYSAAYGFWRLVLLTHLSLGGLLALGLSSCQALRRVIEPHRLESQPVLLAPQNDSVHAMDTSPTEKRPAWLSPYRPANYQNNIPQKRLKIFRTASPRHE